jgi:hypothetical protein
MFIYTNQSSSTKIRPDNVSRVFPIFCGTAYRQTLADSVDFFPLTFVVAVGNVTPECTKENRFFEINFSQYRYFRINFRRHFANNHEKQQK